MLAINGPSSLHASVLFPPAGQVCREIAGNMFLALQGLVEANFKQKLCAIWMHWAHSVPTTYTDVTPPVILAGARKQAPKLDSRG